MRRFLVALAAAIGATPVAAAGENGVVRFATFNASLNRAAPGELLRDLESGKDAQIRAVAEIVQRVRPDVLLVNEFDYDPSGEAPRAFLRNYLGVPQGGAPASDFPQVYSAPVNTGVPSAFDLNHDGRSDGPDDALGFGKFPGQYGMVIYSRYPLLARQARTFRKLLWRAMPRALIPPGWYPPEALAVLPLSSKSHWDLPVRIAGRTVHLLASHPTPPSFDGPEDRNGRRNHDEIRFWADYLSPGADRYIRDDAGRRGGLRDGSFVLLGDLNADPVDGESFDHAVQQLLHHPRVQATAPRSVGAANAAARQRGANLAQHGDPLTDTGDFEDAGSGPGNLRTDYVLPSRDLKVCATGVFWPDRDHPLYRLVGEGGAVSSDHRLVWVDVAVRGPCAPHG
ncbi:MAG: endonuclease/exonuclease/phosphatase family protein [Steroidobacteraceae bacterium]